MDAYVLYNFLYKFYSVSRFQTHDLFKIFSEQNYNKIVLKLVLLFIQFNIKSSIPIAIFVRTKRLTTKKRNVMLSLNMASN